MYRFSVQPYINIHYSVSNDVTLCTRSLCKEYRVRSSKLTLETETFIERTEKEKVVESIEKDQRKKKKTRMRSKKGSHQHDMYVS